MTKARSAFRIGIGLLCMGLPSHVRAAGTITGESGTVSHKNSITLTGSGFGTKTPAAPQKWDDFESGTNGSVVGNGWYTWSNLTGHEPTYSSSVARPGIKGSRSAFQNFSGGVYNATIGLVNQAIRKVYISGWYYMTVGGNASRNFKMLALRGGPPGDWDTPNARMDQYPSTSSGHIYTAEEAPAVCDGLGAADQKGIEDWGVGGTLYTGSWHRFEVWLDTNSAGPSGVYKVWRDLSIWAQASGKALTKDCAFSNLYLSSYFADDGVGTPTPTMQMYWDEVYIDNTPMRVELCNAATWSARTKCEIQIPSAWSDSSVTVTVNQGSFSDGATAWFYVVDSSGQGNASGLQVTIGGGTANQPPSNVNGLLRNDTKP